MISPTDEYVVIGDKLYQLHFSDNSGRKVLIHSSGRIWYDKQRDGAALDRNEAKAEYPEYFL